MPTAKRAAAKITIVQDRPLAKLNWLVHGFSTRVGGFSKAYGGGALNLGITPDDTAEAVGRNRAAFFKELGTTGWPMAWLRQVHSDIIRHVERAPEHTLAGDGLITATPGLLLVIRTADCLPILLVDRKRRAVAALHAGWRSTLRRIAEKGVGEMRRVFGSEPADLRAAIGPGIHQCCFQVGEELREQFQSQFAYADDLFAESIESDAVHERYPLLFLTQRAPGHMEPMLPKTIRLDLVEANRRQLLDAGLAPRAISASPFCSACRTDLLFSHRAEKGKTGRMMAVVGIK